MDARQLISGTLRDWSDAGGPRLGAALAYYTVFSLAPLLIISIAVAGLILGNDAARGHAFAELAGMLGSERAKFIESVIIATSHPRQGLVATSIGFGVLFVGATGFFAQLQDALNTVWRVHVKANTSWFRVLLRYWWSFTMVLGTGFLLLASLVFSTVVSGVLTFATQYWAFFAPILEVVHFFVSLGVSTLLFALIYRNVPNAVIHWREVWLGAFMTALFFGIGRTFLAFYLGREASVSAFGAAGALVAVMIWSYYTAQILLLGASFTRNYAELIGEPLLPEPGFELEVQAPTIH